MCEMAMYVEGLGYVVSSGTNEEKKCKSCGKLVRTICKIGEKTLPACDNCFLTGKIAVLAKKD